MTSKTDNICCPTCQKSRTWTPDNAFRPFCSYRCKLIDLGEWASEKHHVPSDPVSPHDMNEQDDN